MAPKDAWSFRFGPHQRRVVVVPEKLTALGFSLVSWIFTATRDCEPLLRMLGSSVRFRNCFIDRLRPEKVASQLGGGEKSVVIPMGWLYTLDIAESFMTQHGRHGDFAVCLGQSWK